LTFSFWCVFSALHVGEHPQLFDVWLFLCAHFVGDWVQDPDVFVGDGLVQHGLNQHTQNIMHITKYMPKFALAAALATSTLATSAFATDAALISGVEDAIEAAGTGLSTVLVAVIAVVATFILFKLIKRGANKV